MEEFFQKCGSVTFLNSWYLHAKFKKVSAEIPMSCNKNAIKTKTKIYDKYYTKLYQHYLHLFLTKSRIGF